MFFVFHETSHLEDSVARLVGIEATREQAAALRPQRTWLDSRLVMAELVWASSRSSADFVTHMQTAFTRVGVWAQEGSEHYEGPDWRWL